MNTEHYLTSLQRTMRNRWDCLSMADYDGEHSYTYAQLAAEIAKLHTTWRECGVKEGDKIALAGRNCANCSSSRLRATEP